MKVLKFSAKWCIPCKVMTQQLDKLGLSVDEIDVDSADGIQLAKDYGVRTIPTLIAVGNDGFMKTSITGAKSDKELIEFFGKWAN